MRAYINYGEIRRTITGSMTNAELANINIRHSNLLGIHIDAEKKVVEVSLLTSKAHSRVEITRAPVSVPEDGLFVLGGGARIEIIDQSMYPASLPMQIRVPKSCS
jgi:hypothetical protein